MVSPDILMVMFRLKLIYNFLSPPDFVQDKCRNAYCKFYPVLIMSEKLTSLPVICRLISSIDSAKSCK